jgi:hypothetical protein
MRSFVVIFAPSGQKRSEVEAALRQHVDAAEFVENPAATRSDMMEDAEQLPLWRWFISSK